MKLFAALWVFCLSAAAAFAADKITGSTTKFDLKHCKVIEPGDENVYAGTWSCKGYGTIPIIQSSADDRSYAAFGTDGMKHCAFRKTFGPFNTALSPVEWRLKKGKPFAAIERWSVVSDGEGNSVTWLVVNAVRKDESCHVHYVAGSFPNANQAARRAADKLAPGFDCANGMPTVDSKIGPPPIDLISCGDLIAQQQ